MSSIVYYFRLPVLPFHVGGKDKRLLFPLCRTCAKENSEGRKDDSYFCKHFNSKERAWVATTTHMELKLALKHGYTVSRLYRAYLFNK